jgi:hypothetical protein
MVPVYIESVVFKDLDAANLVAAKKYALRPNSACIKER